MNRLQLIWINLRTSFWFLPSLIFAASIAVAIGLIDADSGKAQPWIAQWPRLFGSGAAGARGMLSTIAGSMMTVVGVTFSMTLVTLALASSQYTSRILRNFMADRITQVVLGVFGGIFIYCLIVLRTIRGGEDDYVPSLAVMFGVVLAIGGITILIFFIHHIASSIQASSIIESVANETLSSIDRLLPEPDEHEARTAQEPGERPAPGSEHDGQKVLSPRIGYIQSIDLAALVRITHKHGVLARLERGVGEFVVRGATLAAVSSRDRLPEGVAEDIARAFHVFRFRTIDQDPGFGVRQIVDIALRALSPSVNDTTTGVMCVDYLSAILAHVIERDFPPREHRCAGELRVISVEQTFETLLADAFDQIRGSARGNFSVLSRMLEALRAVAAVAGDARRREPLVAYLSCMRELRDSLESAHERVRFDDQLDIARASLGGSG